MNDRLLVDTDVLIDYLRGRAEAVEFLESRTEELLISAMSIAELHAGVREGEERSALSEFLTAFEIVPIDRATAERGGLLRRDYGRSHGVGLADALIAATAELAQVRLATLNRKHFPMLSGIVLPYTK